MSVGISDYEHRRNVCMWKTIKALQALQTYVLVLFYYYVSVLFMVVTRIYKTTCLGQMRFIIDRPVYKVWGRCVKQRVTHNDM